MIQRRVLAFLSTTAFLAVMLAGCVTSSQEAPAPFLVLGDPVTSGLSAWPGNFQSPLSFYDFDGDGQQEVIAHSTDTFVYVFSGTSGKVLAKLPTKYPPAWYIQQVSNGVAIGVLEPGQSPSIVVGNHASYIAAWRYVPEASGKDTLRFEKSWEVRTTGCTRSPGMDASPVLADLTGDGRLETLVHTEEVGLYALRSDGSTLWSQCWGGGNGDPVVADLNGDGRLEAIFASDAGLISVFDGASGKVQWTFDAQKHGIRPASVSVSPVVADLDDDGTMELLFTARNAPADDPERFDEFHMGIFAVHQDPQTWQAELVWMLQPQWANPLSHTHLIVQDVDGDGQKDIFGMDWNTIGHRPGEWERLGPGHAFRLTADGEEVWVREVDAWWSNKDMALADLDADGEVDLLVNGPRAGVDGIWRLSLETGAANGFIGAPGWKLHGGPRIADLDGTGSTHLVLRVTAEPGPEDRGAILLYEFDTPYVPRTEVFS